MDYLQTQTTKCSKVYDFFFIWFSANIVLKGQEFSVMDCLKIFRVKSKKNLEAKGSSVHLSGI